MLQSYGKKTKVVQVVADKYVIYSEKMHLCKVEMAKRNVFILFLRLFLHIGKNSYLCTSISVVK